MSEGQFHHDSPRAVAPLTAVTLHMRALGELVFALPLLHALRHADPPWRTVCVAHAGLTDLLAASGLADRVLPRLRPRDWRGYRRLVQTLRAERPTVCLSLTPSAGNSLLAAISGARRRLGYDYADLSWLLERVPSDGGGIENYLIFLPPIGVARTVDSYCGLLRVPETDREAARTLLRRAGIEPETPFVAVSPISTGKQGVKAYPLDHWAAVCRGLSQRGPVVVVGSGADRAAHDEIVAGAPDRVVSLAGETSALTLAAVLERASCVVGADTGPIHVAAAMGTRCVVLFGASDPHRTAPSGEGHTILYRGLACQPCLVAPCTHHGACLRDIDPEEVIAAVENSLG
jgi:ADP-heptose:LPS heptosyltransferase